MGVEHRIVDAATKGSPRYQVARGTRQARGLGTPSSPYSYTWSGSGCFQGPR